MGLDPRWIDRIFPEPVQNPPKSLEDSARLSEVPSAQSVIVAVPPSYNNCYPTSRTGRRFLGEEGKRWYGENLPLLAALPKPERYPVRVTYVIRQWVNRARDGSGIEKLLVDGLVKAGVLADDSLKYLTEELWLYRPEDGGVGVHIWWEYAEPVPVKPKPKRKR